MSFFEDGYGCGYILLHCGIAGRLPLVVGAYYGCIKQLLRHLDDLEHKGKVHWRRGGEELPNWLIDEQEYWVTIHEGDEEDMEPWYGRIQDCALEFLKLMDEEPHLHNPFRMEWNEIGDPAWSLLKAHFAEKVTP